MRAALSSISRPGGRSGWRGRPQRLSRRGSQGGYAFTPRRPGAVSETSGRSAWSLSEYSAEACCNVKIERNNEAQGKTLARLHDYSEFLFS